MTNNAETFIEPAIQWAVSQLGCTGYPFKCLGFVEDAYELGNGIVLDGYASAKEEADAFQAGEHTGLPPRGAFVFYDCWGTLMGAYRNWGHVGISLGDGRVIHAWDQVRIDDYLDIQALQAASGWTKPEYIGWAPLETILRGMTVKQRINKSKEGKMIARIWHGWTTPANADIYEGLLKTEIFTGIQGRQIPGYRNIQLLRRELGDEVEFITIMWFDSLDAVRIFAGEDYEAAVVPPKAREVLSRFDARSQHYQVETEMRAADA